MRTINRAGVVIRYREPFLTWAATTDPNGPRPEGTDFSVYLVPEDPSEEQESAPLEQFFLDIFERELEDWCTDESLWPVLRDLPTFLEWFAVVATSVVVDLGRGTIRHDSL